MTEEQGTAERSTHREKLPFDKVRDLNSMEHVLFSSSSPDRLNYALLNRQLEEGVLDPKILAPSGISFPISPEEAQDLQDRRKDQWELVGTSFGFLDMEAQFRIAQSGYQIRLQPVGYINRVTGSADPIWRVSIVNLHAKEGEDKEVQDPELDKLLGEVSEFYAGKLAMSPTLKRGSRYLHPIGLRQKYDI